MAYAPILDASAYSSDMEPDRQLSLAAAAALQRLALDDAKPLAQALRLLYAEQEDADLLDALTRVKGVRAPGDEDGALTEERKAVLRRLIEQLRQVKAFGELDGQQVDEYVGPVGRLIRSGRIEMFPGSSRRPR